MAFSPFARFRNFTLNNLKSLLELYPDAFDSMSWNEVGNIIESEHKGYKKTSYQQACQFGLEDKSSNVFRIQNYLYSFDDDNLKKYLEFWACTYFAPNPYVNSGDEPILIFCEIGKKVLESPNNKIDYYEFFRNYIGGKSDDILLNILKEYCSPLKYEKIDGKHYLFVEKEDVQLLQERIKFIEKEFPIADEKDRKLFFERYSYDSFCKYYDLSNKQNSIKSEDNDSKLKGYNKIFYGIPGCGKSYHIENEVLKDVDKENNVFRTTFYLDYSNSDFIGQIYPKVDENGKVTYEAVPGPFTKALERALTAENEMVYLVIEEINRGNAAAIFGDVFQLLDRLKENRDGRVKGDSEYPISNEFIEGYFRKKGIKFTPNKIYIPHNLTILATMNTSDQNVFPLDTAFKRRWDREKVTNDWDKVGAIKNMYVPLTDITWEQFATTINQFMIRESRESDAPISEDKQMGAYFANENMLSNHSPEEDETEKAKDFANNVLDYLFNDVTKFEHSVLFDNEMLTIDDIYNEVESYSKTYGIDDRSSNELLSNIFNKEVVEDLNKNTLKEDISDE